MRPLPTSAHRRGQGNHDAGSAFPLQARCNRSKTRFTMADSAISDELAAASRSMTTAIEAFMQNELGKVEHALVEVQERTGRLLRELELKRNALAEPPPSEPKP